MENNTLNIIEESTKKIDPISKRITIIMGAIVVLILTVTTIGLMCVPSPNADGTSFFTYLLQSMNVL